MGNLTWKTFLLLWIALILGSFGQICLKLGLQNHSLAVQSSIFSTILGIARAMLYPYVILGLLLYVTSTFFWLMMISRVRLSVAYPLISMSYFLVVILSAVILHEKVNWKMALAGLAFISAGVSFIGLGLGRSGGEYK